MYQQWDSKVAEHNNRSFDDEGPPGEHLKCIKWNDRQDDMHDNKRKRENGYSVQIIAKHLSKRIVRSDSAEAYSAFEFVLCLDGKIPDNKKRDTWEQAPAKIVPGP